MRAFLTKAEAVTETTAAKHKVSSGARDFKSRTLQNIPAQDAPDDDLKIPAPDRLSMFTFEGDEFRAPGFVMLANQNLIEPVTDVGARVALQSPQEIRSSDNVLPLCMRTGNAVFVAHTAQVIRRRHTPEVGDVGCLSTARRAKVRFNDLVVIVEQDLPFGGPDCRERVEAGCEGSCTLLTVGSLPTVNL